MSVGMGALWIPGPMAQPDAEAPGRSGALTPLVSDDVLDKDSHWHRESLLAPSRGLLVVSRARLDRRVLSGSSWSTSYDLPITYDKRGAAATSIESATDKSLRTSALM